MSRDKVKLSSSTWRRVLGIGLSLLAGTLLASCSPAATGPATGNTPTAAGTQTAPSYGPSPDNTATGMGNPTIALQPTLVTEPPSSHDGNATFAGIDVLNDIRDKMVANHFTNIQPMNTDQNGNTTPQFGWSGECADTGTNTIYYEYVILVNNEIHHSSTAVPGNTVITPGSSPTDGSLDSIDICNA